MSFAPFLISLLSFAPQFQGPEPDLEEIHRLIFQNYAEDLKAEAMLLPPFTAVLQYPSGKPLAQVKFRLDQEPALSGLYPAKPIQSARGATNGDGSLSVRVHPGCEHWALWYQLPEEEWRLLERGFLEPNSFDVGRLTLPKEKSISGQIQVSSNGETKPVKAWIWERESGIALHALNLLPNDVLLHGTDLDWMPSAEPIADYKNETDMRRCDDVAIELQMDNEFNFNFRGRLNGPAIAVLDNHGCLHWFKSTHPWNSSHQLRLPDPKTFRVRILDDAGKPAVGAEVAAGGWGGFPDCEILRPATTVGEDGWITVTSYDGKLPTFAARWQSDHPWYTWDWVMRDDLVEGEGNPYILPRPYQVVASATDLSGDSVTAGGVSLVGYELLHDPAAARTMSNRFSPSQPKPTFASSPVDEWMPVVHSDHYFPFPVDGVRSEDFNQLDFVLAETTSVEVHLKDPNFPDSCFPARITLTPEIGFSTVRWMGLDRKVEFQSIAKTPSFLVIEGADCGSIWLTWDGKVERCDIESVREWEERSSEMFDG